VFDKSARNNGTFARADFTYDARRDAYTCPAGKLLTRCQRRHGCRTDEPHADDFFRYRASRADCDACALKPRCCPGADARKVPRSVHEGARNLARAIAEEDEWLVSRRERKKIEMLLPISSASSGSTVCDYAAQTVPVTSSTSPLQPRTSESWPS
jgi:hypothetical protein